MPQQMPDKQSFLEAAHGPPTAKEGICRKIVDHITLGINNCQQCDDKKCPWCKAVREFQKLMLQIKIVLNMRNLEAEMYAEQSDGLLTIVKSQPNFGTPGIIHTYVRDAILKHDRRLTYGQKCFRLIIEGTFPIDSHFLKIDIVWRNLLTWHEYGTEHQVVRHDPWYPYDIFHRTIHAKFLNGDDEEFVADTECLICTEVMIPSGEGDPNRWCITCHCGHQLCIKCYDMWLSKAKNVFNCPFCRACLVCGDSRSPCPYHDLEDTPAETKPLMDFLNEIKHEGFGPLLGFTVDTFWSLREATRDLRIRAALIEKNLREIDNGSDSDSESNPYNLVLDYYEQEYEQVVAEFREVVKRFHCGGQDVDYAFER